MYDRAAQVRPLTVGACPGEGVGGIGVAHPGGQTLSATVSTESPGGVSETPGPLYWRWFLVLVWNQRPN